MKALRAVLLTAAVVWAGLTVITGVCPPKNFRVLCMISQGMVSGLCLVIGLLLPSWIKAGQEEEKK